MTKTNNTPKRNNIVRTRLDDEEHAEFMRQLKIYDMNQSEFIREAISGATIRPVIVASVINDELLSAIGKLTAEYGRVGNNLNQIAKSLNTYEQVDIHFIETTVNELRNMIKKLEIEVRGV